MLPGQTPLPLWTTLPLTGTSFGPPQPGRTISASSTAGAHLERVGTVGPRSGDGDDLAVGRLDQAADGRAVGAVSERSDRAVAEQELHPAGGRRAPVASAAVIAVGEDDARPGDEVEQAARVAEQL